jgi:cellulose synthase/poly-beta-1,6-N-acetylglucosamine synthase-like glycosyltransferase
VVSVISVVACTNREDYVNNIIVNFQKQTLTEKELILILNSSSMNLNRIEYVLGELAINCQILQFPNELSLGECLNKGVGKAKYDFIAKMDDDDYYGSKFLKEANEAMIGTKSDIVGKSTFYIYFKQNQEVRLYNPNHENHWILNNGQSYNKSSNFLSGATMVFRKEIFKKVTFPAINQGEDSSFQRLCFENRMKMYSLSKEHYVYIRYDTPQHHTSDARESILRRRSRLVTSTSAIADFMDQRER